MGATLPTGLLVGAVVLLSARTGRDERPAETARPHPHRLPGSLVGCLPTRGLDRQPGDSPEDDWRRRAQAFAARHEGYQEIRIEPTEYRSYRAAIWEFTYVGGGTTLHAVDLGFVTGRWGFALNFQTRERDWQRLQPTFEQFKSAFQPPT